MFVEVMKADLQYLSSALYVMPKTVIGNLTPPHKMSVSDPC